MTATAPTAADFRARNRVGGLFTETVNQRIGSYLCVVAYRYGLAPTVLTLANLVIGLGTSIAVILLADAKTPLIGLGALVLSQLAYSLDCADRQLARVTGRAGPGRAPRGVPSGLALQVSLAAAGP